MGKSEPELAPQIEKAREAIDNICQLMPGDSTSDNWRKSFAKMKTYGLCLECRYSLILETFGVFVRLWVDES